MTRLLLMTFSILFTTVLFGNTIKVKNIEELNAANKKAKPGDIIILSNGEWKDVTINLTCNGTIDNPILFKAEEAGKVILTGLSMLRLGGKYIEVDGFYFANGFAGNDAAIRFRVDKNQVANHCRVTNTVINDYNNPKRLDENYWVMFYGKHNRLDHCSILNKKNMAVIVAIMLDDESGRENFHSIDHNYFGVRLPLASNSGEIIRVGVSEYCQFNSNTQITDNFFEHCDGETEIISLKSCQNIVRNNLFKECQGTVVLRHGNFNTVENNIFLGNGKEGTGGVRIINKGQWVVNNLFYKCRGTGFRSPLAVMNGVPNSPANRYVAVTDAVIANNSWIDCTPMSFCEGSDTERSVPPKNVQFINNIISNNTDNVIYYTFDSINGIHFSGNLISKGIKENTTNGFIRTNIQTIEAGKVFIPVADKNPKSASFDSLYKESLTRLTTGLTLHPGFSDMEQFKKVKENAFTQCGAGWFSYQKILVHQKQVNVKCNTAEDILSCLAKNKNAKLNITLTGKEYSFSGPVLLNTDVLLSGNHKTVIKFIATSSELPFLFQLEAGNSLALTNLNLDLSGIKNFITTDTSGSCNHINFSFTNCRFTNMSGTFFRAAKTSVADSIFINQCVFSNAKGKLFDFSNETDKKGYYNVEKLKITSNKFIDCKGQILTMLRGGNDESTMGPYLVFEKNNFENCETADSTSLIQLSGTQRSGIKQNLFKNCNPGKTLIQYTDWVRADHLLSKNILNTSGKIVADKFVAEMNNIIQ